MPFSPHGRLAAKLLVGAVLLVVPLVGCSAPAIGDRSAAWTRRSRSWPRWTPDSDTAALHRLFRDRIEQAKADDTATSWEQHRRVDLDR